MFVCNDAYFLGVDLTGVGKDPVQHALYAIARRNMEGIRLRMPKTVSRAALLIAVSRKHFLFFPGKPDTQTCMGHDPPHAPSLFDDPYNPHFVECKTPADNPVGACSVMTSSIKTIIPWIFRHPVEMNQLPWNLFNKH